jgi:flavin-dependent dehydrogenase
MRMKICKSWRTFITNYKDEKEKKMTDKIMMELAKLQTRNRMYNEEIKTLRSNLRNRDEEILKLKLELEQVNSKPKKTIKKGKVKDED